MRRILIAAGFLLGLSLPAWAVCPTPLTAKDAAGTTQNLSTTDDAASSCAANIMLMDSAGTNLAGVNSSHQLAIQAPPTLPLPSNAAQETGGNLASIKTDTDALNLAQGSTTSGQNGNLAMCAVLSGTPSYTTLQTSPISCSTAGALRIVISPGTTTIGGSAVGTAGSASTNIVSIQGIASMTPVLTSPAPATSGGLTNFFLQPAASDNHANIKNGAGQVYHVAVTNNSTTINYLRLYNAATGFNGCGSATNLIMQLAIPATPATAVGAGFVEDISQGVAFSTGISICVTSGYATTDTTNATASAMSVNVMYK